MNRCVASRSKSVFVRGSVLPPGAAGKSPPRRRRTAIPGRVPATVEPDMDANNFKVDHPEQFPLATAGEYIAAPELNVTGVVSPDVSRQVPVPSLASGRVVEIDARLGDEVKKGQLLFKVRSTDIAGAFSDYQQGREERATGEDPTGSRQAPVRQRGHSQERARSRAERRG